ncbi:MAG: amidohydrolase family protein [Myxococcota bacterium]
MNRLLLVLAAVTACRRDPPDGPTSGSTVDTDTADADADTDTDTDADADSDADTDSDADADPGAWTKGPALPACTPTAGDANRIALSGVVLTPTDAVGGFVVIDRGSNTVTCAGAGCDTTGATIVCTGGVISPALIDTHDHTQYNVLGPWQHADLYTDRYDWQSDGDYYDFREAYDGMSDTYECETVKWAELRQIVGGATAVVGSTGDACVEVLARNLDEEESAHGIDGYGLQFSSSRVEYYDGFDADDRYDDLVSGVTDVFLDHVAEGVNGSVRSEIDHMFDIGMVGPGSVFVHATDASVEQLAAMAATSTSIVWSPRSNLDLYADTTKADLAFRLGVPLAIGPDWTWSGSNSIPEELACAREWLVARGSEITDVDLWQMVTLDASVVLGLQGQLGMLAPGAKADIAVFPWRDEPYRAVIEAAIDDVLLVMIDGDARYGDPALVAGLEANPAWCEAVTACAAARTLCVAEGDAGTDAIGYAELEATLSLALAETTMPAGLEYAGELYPLWACDEVRPTCDPRTPSADDADGDGLADGIDSCPAGYDPTDADQDGDGIGDVCDDCLLSPEASCTHNPDDIDGDGIENDDDACPYLYDLGSPDSDGDGKADACDECPDDPNPGDLGCPSTIHAIRDPSDPNHPPVGRGLSVSGVVVTAVGSFSMFVQDPSESEFGGLYVLATGASVGDEVTVTGVYDEYFGLSELGDATVTVTGSAPVPAPIAADPCDVGAGGPDAERFESMLVEVGPVDVTNANPDSPSDFDEWEVGGCLRVDDLLCPDCWLDQPALGTAYSRVTGPLYYSFSATKLVPRDAGDLVP